MTSWVLLYLLLGSIVYYLVVSKKPEIASGSGLVAMLLFWPVAVYVGFKGVKNESRKDADKE